MLLTASQPRQSLLSPSVPPPVSQFPFSSSLNRRLLAAVAAACRRLGVSCWRDCGFGYDCAVSGSRPGLLAALDLRHQWLVGLISSLSRIILKHETNLHDWPEQSGAVPRLLVHHHGHRDPCRDLDRVLYGDG